MNDVREFIEWVEAVYEPSVRVAPRAGHYTRQPGETSLDLYGVADMACVLATIGRLHPHDVERADWADAFAGLQDENGWFVEATPTHDRVHSTAYTMAAMELCGLRPRRPLHFARTYASPGAVEQFLDSLDWRTNVYMDSHKGAGLASIFSLDPSLGSLRWFDRYFSGLDRRFDPANGMLGEGKPPDGDIDQIGGTFHYHFLYEWHHRRMPYPEARVDAVLGLQHGDGFWTDASVLWVTLDALYLMTRTVERTGYRYDDVRHAARRVVDGLDAQVLHPERRSEHFGWYLGAHSLTAALSILAEAQRFLGHDEVVTDRPLRLVLDRRPFI